MNNISISQIFLKIFSKEMIKNRIIHEMDVGGDTFIGAALQMGIHLLNQRQTKNPLTGLLLLTDGVDTKKHDYFRLIHQLPSNTPCHTFGFGIDHQTNFLIKLAELSHMEEHLHTL